MRSLGARAEFGVPEPFDELEHDGIPPHPGGESLEPTESRVGGGIVAFPAHVSINPVGIGPVCFDRDGAEALLEDQPLGDFGALGVKVVRAMRSFTKQHELRIAYQIEKRSVVGGAAV